MKRLQAKLGYQFKNSALLTQALTHASAVHEHVAGSSHYDFNALELVGDAFIKAELSAHLLASNPGLDAGALHDALQPCITNEGHMRTIARNLDLDELIMRGHGAAATPITDKMRVDVLEAVIGAVVMDCRDNSKGTRAAGLVVQRLWAPYLIPTPSTSAALPAAAARVAPVRSSAMTDVAAFLPATARPAAAAASVTSAGFFATGCRASVGSPPLSPRTQRMFTGIGGSCTPEQFEAAVSAVPDINRQNIGKKGDTALMHLAREKKIRDSKELPKIEILLRHGASWTAPNRRGDTAETVLREKHPELVTRFRL